MIPDADCLGGSGKPCAQDEPWLQITYGKYVKYGKYAVHAQYSLRCLWHMSTFLSQG